MLIKCGNNKVKIRRKQTKFGLLKNVFVVVVVVIHDMSFKYACEA